MSDAIIVTRHLGALQFICHSMGWPAPDTFTDLIITDDEEFFVIDVRQQVSEQDVYGKCIFGNVPLKLASAAKMVYAIEFTGQPPRGREYTLRDMLDAGARLATYRAFQWPCDDLIEAKWPDGSWVWPRLAISQDADA